MQFIPQLSTIRTHELESNQITMTITDRVQGAFFNNDSGSDDARIIRLAPNAPPSKGPTRRQGRPWTHEEHDCFLHAMEMYPSGPWKDIAEHVGTRTTRQTMTHAQKYRQKIARWKRGVTIKAPACNPPTPPGSPQSTEEVYSVLEETAEDAIFWQGLEGILEETDSAQFEQSMAVLLEQCGPMDLMMVDASALDVEAIFENFATLV